jgi:hypothetical protein
MGDTDSRYGFALFARKVSEDADAYQIVSTAYRKQDKDNTVDWAYVTLGTTDTKEVEITGNISAADAQAYVNSPLILRNSGRIATVIAQSESEDNKTTLTLDRQIEIPAGELGYVLRERTPSGNYEDRSPAIYTMTVTTALDD